MDSFTIRSLIKECFPLNPCDGLGILESFFTSTILKALCSTEVKVKADPKISKDDKVTDVGSKDTDSNRTSLSASQRSTEEGILDFTKQSYKTWDPLLHIGEQEWLSPVTKLDEDDENLRRLLSYIIDENVKSLEMMEETCDFNQKIPLRLLLKALNDREKHKGASIGFNFEQNQMDTHWMVWSMEMLNRNLVSPFRLCILYRRFEVLTFLSSLELVDEMKIRDHLINSDEEIRRPILLGLKKRLEKRYPKASVFLGRKHKCLSPMFLVHVSSDSMPNKTNTIAGIEVKMINPYKTDELENKNFDENEKMFDDNIIELLQDARREHEDELYERHSNLNAIGISSINSRNSEKEFCYEPCLVLYCSDKGFIRYGEDCFPPFLEYKGKNIPVDVRGGITVPLMTSAGSKQEYEQKIRMGCSIHRNGNEFIGSIGPFVEEMGRNEVDFLTCAHVLYPTISKGSIDKLPRDENNTSNAVYFCSSSKNKSVCGFLLFGYFLPEKGVDICVVEIAKSVTPTEGHFRAIRKENTVPNVGPLQTHGQYMFNTGKMMKIEEVKRFMKSRRNTCANPIMIGTSSGCGPSFGRLHLDGVLESTRLEFGNAKFVMKDLYRVTPYRKPFIQAGDSGSGVFVEKDSELYCIGISLAGDIGGAGYVTPIDSVMGVLGDKFSLKQFYTRRHTVPKAAKKSNKAKRNCSE